MKIGTPSDRLRMLHPGRRILPLVIVYVLLVVTPDADARYETVHSHSYLPYGGTLVALVADSQGNLIGATAYGGASNRGAIFRMNADGSQFEIVHAFTGGSSDGAVPISLVFDGSGALYGTTLYGGTSNAGTVFKMNLDGSGYSILRSFLQQSAVWLTIDRSGDLLGSSLSGGSAFNGAIFKMSVDGTGFTTLHEFDGRDGAGLFTPLTLDEEGNIYGVAAFGGVPNFGTLFTLKSDGTAFRVLHTFSAVGDGQSPRGALVLDRAGGIYGTTYRGGSANQGAVFTLRTDGTGYELLHSFTGNDDGAHPLSLLLQGSAVIYGTTAAGGSANHGTLFSVATHTSVIEVLHSFGGETDGDRPDTPIVSGRSGFLYGASSYGGTWNSGTAFRLRVDGSAYGVIRSFVQGSDGKEPWGALVPDGNGSWYGTTYRGGFHDWGTVFVMRGDGTGFRPLHSFDQTDGAAPRSPVTLDATGNLFGTTDGGGESGAGTIFTMKTDGSGYVVLHSFSWADRFGTTPRGKLVLGGDGYLYGVTAFGGISDFNGTVFRLRVDGTDFAVLHSFTGSLSDGYGPSSDLVMGRSSTLYGMTSGGGSSNLGSVFRLRTDGSGYALVHHFSGGVSDGAQPGGSLLLDDDDVLYGTTDRGGSMDHGTIFRVAVDGAEFAVLHNFPLDTADGGAHLARDQRGNLYGTTAYGGSNGTGTVFRLKADGSAFTTLHEFELAPSDGVYPFASVIPDERGYLYGTTIVGGSRGDPFNGHGGDGTEFRLVANPGDADGDGDVTIGDVFYLINGLFASGPPPYAGGDANGDGAVDTADVFYLINFLFAGGPAPHN